MICWQAFRIKQRGQLPECLSVDAAFEVNDFLEGLPISHPAPSIEFRSVACVEAESILATIYPKHEPYLFLADTEGRAVAADETFGEVIAQPVLGASEQGHMLGMQTDLFPKFPEHSLFGGFTRLDSPLRKLPSVLACASSPK